MGIKAKSARSEKRKREKRAKKAAKAALYKSYSEKGQASGSKRTKKTHKVISSLKGQHAMSDCGNVGCKKCYPRLNAAKPKTLVQALKEAIK
jgi:hypothetical protein